MTAFFEAILQQKRPLLWQPELHGLRETAAGILGLGRDRRNGWARRRMTTAEMQLFAACEAICEVVQESVTGNYVLRASPKLPVERQLKLSEDAA